MSGPAKVLIAKPGLDGHDQGAKVVARALLDAGFEVHYTGLRQSPEAVAQTALEEDVDVIGLSSLAGSHLPFCRRLKELIDEMGLADKLWIIGGNIPAQDVAALEGIGLDGVFATGSKLQDITDFIKERLP
ncbi:MAG: cobalamin B12-binding domain-containing protein [Alphaproteobacteria bacterium]|jgi:methylmalonyl-CoA mutase C-terminal domain/subunit|nr:cobalamin B12-binding domain-containing protein [Alphaproteobacteria bacterium]MDP6563328.1 cobalamin B12-binding domain-containing protein [Alphaproteobacteria bacterium]MDP6814850.1 cobalamin B12-binding domain-containing protein [Alphaproteobacteria bacterium]